MNAYIKEIYHSGYSCSPAGAIKAVNAKYKNPVIAQSIKLAVSAGLQYTLESQRSRL